MLYYQKINVPDYAVMREELVNFASENVNKNTRYWDVYRDKFKDTCPTFFNFVTSNSKIPVRLCRFYLTPPNELLDPHIDGLIANRSPIGLNFPIIGWENTTMEWYDCPKDNLVDGEYGFGKINSSMVVDRTRLVKVDSVTIDVPTFVRTDIVHGVTNLNPFKRLILSVRWYNNDTLGQHFNQVFDVEKFI
jgi:hypothetical protein